MGEGQSRQEMPVTPAGPTQAASAPPTRLRKRASVGRPLTSSSTTRGGMKTLVSTPENKLNYGSGIRAEGQPSLRGSAQSLGHGPFTVELQHSENTPPSWLRRKSTPSSLKNGSPETALRPESSSISYSNGSTAPILPSYTESSPSVSSRNKLVKRSSSQRLLNGSRALHSTLRRPATSHQRSATLQQQLYQGEISSRPSLTASSFWLDHTLGDEQSKGEDSQIWLPSFKAQPMGTSGDGSSRKRNTNGNTTRNDPIKTIVPDMTEIATLLMATSLSHSSASDESNGRASNLSRLDRTVTPQGLNTLVSSHTARSETEVGDDPEPKPRSSFSLSEMFPSPSPSTWKMPRTSSVRKPKPLVRDSNGRRVVSAPQINDQSQDIRSAKQQGPHGSDFIPASNAEESISQSPGRTNSHGMQQRSPTSPLPPLDHLSTFEIDLPGTVSSYPTTPQLDSLGNLGSSPQEQFSHPSQSTSSSSGPSASKFGTYRISSAPSEPGSTLLGSDNDNSRLMSGDEDDLDSRSETIYDSTRTGATSSSQSGIRRPPIDTIFDESPPPEIPSKAKLIDLQDLVHRNDLFLDSGRQDHHTEREPTLSTPVRATKSCKEDDSPTPMNVSEVFLSPEISSSSPLAQLEPKTPNQPSQNGDPDQDDELWSFENAEISHAEAVHIRNVSLSGSNSPLTSSNTPSEAPRRRRSPPLAAGQSRPSKPNIFEWSEQSLTEKESSNGGSPRPKTVHGRQGKEMLGNHGNGRRGPSALHLRSQSVPVQKDMLNRRSHNNPATVDSWILGNKGPSEDWDGDFDFDEGPRTSKQPSSTKDAIRPNLSSGMLVPRTILERQASVHGQFGQVKELALLVEDLKRLQQQAAGQGIMQGQSVELWKEAEGIINLATLDDDEQELFPPRSPHSPSFDFDAFEEESPSIRCRRKSMVPPGKEDRASGIDDSSPSLPSSRPSQDLAGSETPPRPISRSRKDSSAKAKSVLETIHQQRSHHNASLLNASFAQKKLPFDTTSLKDLVIRAGVVTRALKEIVRRAENGPGTPEPRPSTSRDPPYISQMFHRPPTSPTLSKSPRITQSPKSPKSPRSQKSGTFMGDNDINGHMKIMTVV